MPLTEVALDQERVRTQQIVNHAIGALQRTRAHRDGHLQVSQTDWCKCEIEVMEPDQNGNPTEKWRTFTVAFEETTDPEEHEVTR